MPQPAWQCRVSLTRFNMACCQGSISRAPSVVYGVMTEYDAVCLIHLKLRTAYRVTIGRRIPPGQDRLDRTYTLTQRTVISIRHELPSANNKILPTRTASSGEAVFSPPLPVMFGFIRLNAGRNQVFGLLIIGGREVDYCPR